MNFDFGPLANFIEVTAQYSNAVLLAISPYVADFAGKLDWGPVVEFSSNKVTYLYIDPRKEDVAGSIVYTNGYIIGFEHGRINGFISPRAFSREDDPDRVPFYFAPVCMRTEDAVDLARSTLKKLGIPLSMVFADLVPQVVSPEVVGTNVIPFYEVRWREPRGSWCVRVEIDGNKKTAVRLDLSSENLNREPFKIGVVPRLRPDHPITGLRLEGINPEYGIKLFPLVMREVTSYADRLDIKMPKPLTTNHIKRFYVTDNGGWPHAELELTNGSRFIYRNTTVTGHFAPDELWHSEGRGKILISDFKGDWKMTDEELVAMARTTTTKLGYPKGFIHTEGQPKLQKPKEPFSQIIPRCLVQWMYPTEANMTQWIYVEIDADKRQVKAVYFDDESFRSQRPPIDVPIAIPKSAMEPAPK